MGTRTILIQWHVDRLMKKVEKRGTCWVWTGSLNFNGYAMTTIGGRQTVAHRALYELLVDNVPEGLVLDHLCRLRSCVNPDHLEPVTPRTNVLRGKGVVARSAERQTCFYGHPLVPRTDDHPRRYCKVCNAERMAWQRSSERESVDS